VGVPDVPNFLGPKRGKRSYGRARFDRSRGAKAEDRVQRTIRGAGKKATDMRNLDQYKTELGDGVFAEGWTFSA